MNISLISDKEKDFNSRVIIILPLPPLSDFAAPARVRSSSNGRLSNIKIHNILLGITTNLEFKDETTNTRFVRRDVRKQCIRQTSYFKNQNFVEQLQQYIIIHPICFDSALIIMSRTYIWLLRNPRVTNITMN